MPEQVRPAATVHPVAEHPSRHFAVRHSVRRGNLLAAGRSSERADVHAERVDDGHRCHTARLLVSDLLDSMRGSAV